MNKEDLIQSPKSVRVTDADKPSVFRALGVSDLQDKIHLLIHSRTNDSYHFDITTSTNGFDFAVAHPSVSISVDRVLENIHFIKSIQLMKVKGGYALFYEKVTTDGVRVCYAKGTDLTEFVFQEYVDHWKEVGAVVRAISTRGSYLSLHVDEGKVLVSTSTDLKEWKSLDNRKHTIQDSYSPIDLQHISCIQREGDTCYVWFHFNNPALKHKTWSVGWFKLQLQGTKTYFSPALHVWEQPHEWQKTHVYPVGTVIIGDEVIGYWGVEGIGLFAIKYHRHPVVETSAAPRIALEKHESNPMVAPKADVSWEAFNTLNAAVVQADDAVHILYRAQGHDYVSVLGYVISRDGVSIDYRSPVPAYTPYEDFERRIPNVKMTPGVNYGSGGGYGGVEDPRITIIGDRAYMIYVAYDGWSPPRLALTSIKVVDFLAKRWLWERPILISPPGIVDKSGCILPEKVNGKYVIFHRIFPNILIDYVDSLEFDGNTWLKGEYVIPIRKNNWDSRKIGAGAPPIKTPYGWLLIYYAVDERDPGRYKIGAMLLDLDDPTKVLHRTNHPILEPTEWYENNGFKPGIAYPCGAVVMDETLYVYYGGSDTYVCVATANLQEFLAELRYHEEAHVSKAVIHKIFHH